MNIADCETVFRQMLDKEPYDYQARAWGAVLSRCDGGPPVLIEAPTAAGKTEAAVTPYLTQHYRGEYPVARRLIYVLPSRSLVEAQKRRIQTHGQKLGLPLTVSADHGAAGPLPMFFGDVVVTTWDSFLYGFVGQRTLPRRFTIPAGNIATAMVVFDEVQMYQDGYFYTQRLIGRLAETLESAGMPLVFMTATLSQAHREEILSLRGYSLVTPDAKDKRKPVRGAVEVKFMNDKSVYDLLAEPEVQSRFRAEVSRGDKVLIVVNTVARAIGVHEILGKNGWSPNQVLLLHSRFLTGGRREREEKVIKGDFSLLVATQVVEAGLDIPRVTTGLIEAAPPDALIQRVGRVARRPGEKGMVWVVEPKNPGEEGLALSPYAFVSEARIDDLKVELASGEIAKRQRDKAAGEFALTINEAMRRAVTQLGTGKQFQGAVIELESCRKLIDPFYRKLWNAWRNINGGQSQENSEA